MSIWLTPIWLWIFLLFTFLGYWLNSTQTYILQITPKKAWGLLFGIAESIIAIGTLIATFLIPWFEQQSLMYAWILLVFLMIVRYIWTYFLASPKIKIERENIWKKELFNLLHHIKKWWHFIKFNKFYPLFHIITMFFEGVFYASVWFLFPLFIASAAENLFGWLSLGIYEIITIFFGWFFGWMADKYNWKKVYIIWWILVMFGVSFFFINVSNVMFLIIIGWAIIWIGNNMVFGASSHILEKTDSDHREDWSFIALQKIVNGLWCIIMPVIMWFIINKYSISVWLKTLSIIIIFLWVFSILFLFKKRD
jgi:MFS family permease